LNSETANFSHGGCAAIVKVPRNFRLSENFTIKEFSCPSCDEIYFQPGFVLLVNKLQALRSRIGKPVTVTSGYRCPEHNRVVGGAKNSLHMLGVAADIFCNIKYETLLHMCEDEFTHGGIGRYKNHKHVHVDVGPKRRWVV